MSTLVLGDLHLKQPFILPHLLGYVRDPELAVGRGVFLGDACDCLLYTSDAADE